MLTYTPERLLLCFAGHSIVRLCTIYILLHVFHDVLYMTDIMLLPCVYRS